MTDERPPTSDDLGLGLTFEQQQALQKRLSEPPRRFDLAAQQTACLMMIQSLQDQILSILSNDYKEAFALARKNGQVLGEAINALSEFTRPGSGDE